MVDSIGAASLLGHRPFYREACRRDPLYKQKEFHPFSLPLSGFVGRKVFSSRHSSLTTEHAVSTPKALAMELTKEANSFTEEERMRRTLNSSVGSRTKPRLWPPQNKADDPSLHNPLLRQERLGCGWVGAILEWEGVIVEDKADLEKQSWLALSQEEGKSPPPAFILRRIEGMKTEQAISEVLCWSRDLATLRRLGQRKEEIYQSLHGDFYRVRSGSQEFVTTLINYKIPIALVSTRSRKNLEMAIKSIGFAGFFSVILAAEDAFRGKPDPEMFLYAAQLLDLIPERCIVFGNSNSSVEAAHDVQMKCIAIASKHPIYELGAADLVVRYLDELSIVDVKNLADIDAPEFKYTEPEVEMEEEKTFPSTSVGVKDIW